MKVIKIIDKTPIVNEEGYWQLFCQVLIGSSYVYGAVLCETMDEAFAIKEGQILDVEKVKFSRRTNNV